MTEQEKRRRARRARQQRRAVTTFCLLTAAIILASVYIIYSVLAGPGSIGHRSNLTENPYTPADFATVDGYVTCTAGPTRRGVDVSEYQEDVDWDQVKAAGFDFAFIRIGYRGYSIGQIKPDDLAREHLAGARAAGLDVGVYFYAQAISPEEAAEEARWCLDFLQGETLDLPVVYDWEWVSRDSRTGSMDRETLTECAKTFCQIIEQNGHQAMIYFNSHVARDLLDLEELAEYPFWLAQYKDQMDFPHRVDLWQYTETGSVPGIKGDVDIDLMFIYE